MYTVKRPALKAEVQVGPKCFGLRLTAGSLAAAILLAAPAEAQTGKAATTTAWTPARTADGQPDLQGVWTNATLTPFERPPRLAGKATITEQEAAAIEKRASENRAERSPQPGDTGSYNQAFFDSGTTWLSTRQSSLVVEPSNGRVPLKPSAEAQRDYDLAHVADSYIYHTSWERCITRGVPAGMFPAGYNNAYRDSANSRLRGDLLGNDSRSARDPAGWARRTCPKASANGTAIRSVTGRATRWWWIRRISTGRA